MSVVAKYPHVNKPPGEPARLERLPRIHLSQIVLPHLMHAWSAEELGRQYPHLRMAEVHAALAYYYDHTEEMMREIEAELAEDEQLRKQAAGSAFRLQLRAKLKG